MDVAFPRGAVPEAWKWLQSVGQIPGLPSVRLLKTQVADDEVLAAAYDLRGAGASPDPDAHPQPGFFPIVPKAQALT